MSAPKDGGPAFPVSHDMALVAGLEQAYGISRRAYFAGQAMRGFCANPSITPDAPVRQAHFDSLAADAVRMADSMLKALES